MVYPPLHHRSHLCHIVHAWLTHEPHRIAPYAHLVTHACLCRIINVVLHRRYHTRSCHARHTAMLHARLVTPCLPMFASSMWCHLHHARSCRACHTAMLHATLTVLRYNYGPAIAEGASQAKSGRATTSKEAPLGCAVSTKRACGVAGSRS